MMYQEIQYASNHENGMMNSVKTFYGVTQFAIISTRQLKYKFSKKYILAHIY